MQEGCEEGQDRLHSRRPQPSVSSASLCMLAKPAHGQGGSSPLPGDRGRPGQDTEAWGPSAASARPGRNGHRAGATLSSSPWKGLGRGSGRLRLSVSSHRWPRQRWEVTLRPPDTLTNIPPDLPSPGGMAGVESRGCRHSR